MEARTVFSENGSAQPFVSRTGRSKASAVKQNSRDLQGVGRAQDRAEVSGVLDAVEQEHAGLHPERALLRQAQGE